MTVKCTPDNRKVTVCGFQCIRKQYSLRHVGASTITKQTGNTIMGKCAIEVTNSCSPWDKAQVVVMLSRTTKGKDIIIICDDKKTAIDVMWRAITRSNQWTEHEEQLIERLSVNPSRQMQLSRSVDYTTTYPFCKCDILLPTDDTGFLYMLIST